MRVVLQAILAVACASAPAWFSGQTPTTFRVMTWNIAAGSGGLVPIAEAMRAAAPDIVALQEVDVHWSERSGFADQAARLAEAVGLSARFGPIYRLPGGGPAPSREFGLAILSRHPVVEFRNHVIPRLSTQSTDTEPQPLPGFLEASIEVGPARVRLFNTHLDYRADARVRALQVAAMLKLIGADGATLLAGDLNAPSTAPELAPLFRRLADVWPADGDAGLTYPAKAPVRRIDYILASADLQVRAVRVLPVPASDHRPVVADLAVR